MAGLRLNGRVHDVPVNTKPNLGMSAVALQEEHILRDENVPSVKDLLRVLWRRLWVILLVTVVLTGSVVSYDLLLRTPTYEATISILVGQEQDSASPSSLGGDVQGLQQFTQTVARVAQTRTVADAVIEQLDLQTTPEGFLANMSVRQIGQTQVIQVSYRDPDPERAQEIANTIGTVFSEQVSEVSTSANAITATVWETAALPTSPASPNPLRDALLALILSGVLGVSLAFLLEFLDDRWRSPEEVEQVSGVPTFGIIREFKIPKKGGG